MQVTPTELQDVFLLSTEPFSDDRGWFLRTYAQESFEANGLTTVFPHHNLSLTREKGILRGLHYQIPPRAETKVVHCISGRICDVIVDLRPESSSFRHHQKFELGHPGLMLYFPPGFAHGFQTLQRDTMVMYLMGDFYSPEHERGLRWNDPALGIDWPLEPTVSEKDANHPDVVWEAAWPPSG